MTDKFKPRIALVLGGTSPEREVSKLTGKSIYEALKFLGYEVKGINPAYGTNQPDDVNKLFSKEDFAGISNQNYLTCIASELFDNIDLAFLALHGKWGEDGTIQSLFELRGINYTGSKVLASSISMDKAMSKRLFKHFDIITPDWIL
ncbi:MAG TPA: D-alanine--D-alanine ligase, partial [Ignavibacteria bacterium]|nr:D-alanine--D-alanine ligase [Ignavibacteria bacterium]